MHDVGVTNGCVKHLQTDFIGLQWLELEGILLKLSIFGSGDPCDSISLLHRSLRVKDVIDFLHL